MSELVNLNEDFNKTPCINKYLTFSIEENTYAIDIFNITDIVGIQKITEIPDQPGYIKGVVNLRGRIIPTMDIRLRFNKIAREYDDRTVIIVIEIKDVTIGLVVDRVLEVLELDNKNISTPPKFNSDFKNKYISGIGKFDNNIIVVINCNYLLNENEIIELASLN